MESVPDDNIADHQKMESALDENICDPPPKNRLVAKKFWTHLCIHFDSLKQRYMYLIL